MGFPETAIDRLLPEIKERHIFTAKLRVVAFLGFWLIYFYFLYPVVGQTYAVAAVVLASFALAMFAHLAIARKVFVIPALCVQLFADLTVITAIIYLTDGPFSSYYTIYLFYVFVAGVIYNHYLAALIALASAIYYFLFLMLCNAGIIPPLILEWGDNIPVPTYTPFAHLIFAVVFLAGIVYTVRVASIFSQRRERMLERANEALKSANLVKSEFLATMSHELRTPLTAIIGFSELLMEGVMGELTEEQKDSLKEVLHNAADLLDLINSLLDLTKIESGRMKLDIREFDIREIVKRAVGTITPLVQRKNQNLSVSTGGAIPPITADEKKVQQLVLNLLANANKFTPEGGSINMEVSFHPSPEELQRGLPAHSNISKCLEALDHGAVKIVVSDNGIGIGPDHLDKIFEMFHQVDKSVTRNFGGTGVGLALARKFVELHGGRVWAESEEGKGAKFTIVLPLVADALSNKFSYTALPSSQDPQRTPEHASGLVRRAPCLKEFLGQCYRKLIGRHTRV